MATAEMDINGTSAKDSNDNETKSEHPMVTRRRKGLHNIFQNIPEEQVLSLRQKFLRRGSALARSRESRNGSVDDTDASEYVSSSARRRSVAMEGVQEEPSRGRRKSLTKDGVASGRVSKPSGRQRKVGVVYPDSPPRIGGEEQAQKEGD